MSGMSQLRNVRRPLEVRVPRAEPEFTGLTEFDSKPLRWRSGWLAPGMRWSSNSPSLLQPGEASVVLDFLER